VQGNQHAVFTFINRREPLDAASHKRVVMHSVKAGMTELLEDLLEMGGSVNVLDTRSGPHPVVINVTWDEPLWWACYFGKPELVQYLVKLGVNLGVADGNKHNLFHWCSMWGLPIHTTVLELLSKEQSVAMTAMDNMGRTPLDIAVECGNTANVKLLGGTESQVPQSRTPNTWEDAKSIASDGKEDGGSFLDFEFGNNLKSLCFETETAQNLLPRFSNVEWKRPSEIVQGTVPRLDLSQLSQVELGCCGNAWLLSSVLVAMEMPYGLTTIFEQREIVKEGCYSFVFRFGGAEAKIIVDDRVPCLEGEPMYAGFGAGNNIAFMLLEKALAKLVGSYEGLATGCGSELFRVSPIGQALYQVAAPPDFVEDAELTELVQEVTKSACIMLLTSSLSMYGDHSSPESFKEITEFFTHEVTPAGMGVMSVGNKHVWAAQPKRVLPGTGSCSCQEPVVTIQVNVKARVRVETNSAESTENIRVFQTAEAGEHWKFVWRHAVAGSATEFDLLLEPSVHPYIIFFTQMGDEQSKPCAFDLWSDKELVIGMVDNNDDLMVEISKL